MLCHKAGHIARFCQVEMGGMNIISGCYLVLFREHGNNLLSSPLVKQAKREWGCALSECQQMERFLQTGHVGEAVTPPGQTIGIPVGSVTGYSYSSSRPPATKVQVQPLALYCLNLCPMEKVGYSSTC